MIKLNGFLGAIQRVFSVHSGTFFNPGVLPSMVKYLPVGGICSYSVFVMFQSFIDNLSFTVNPNEGGGSTDF